MLIHVGYVITIRLLELLYATSYASRFHPRNFQAHENDGIIVYMPMYYSECPNINVPSLITIILVVLH